MLNHQQFRIQIGFRTTNVL